jgi:imidazolonepropionase-like amidohydrolase/dienelactone hydrolase/Tol biopolymer transport system component
MLGVGKMDRRSQRFHPVGVLNSKGSLSRLSIGCLNYRGTNMRELFFRIKSSLFVLMLACITLVTCTGLDGSAQQPMRGGLFSAHKTTITPHWFAGNTRFWYQNDLQGGKHEFILVDASRGVREAAFDHKLMAEALRKAGMNDSVAGNLLIDNLYFEHDDNALVFREGNSNWRCDLKSYSLRKLEGEEDKAARRRSQLPLANVPAKSTRNGPASLVTFINKTPGVVELFWLDMSGERRSYGQLQLGQQRQQPTYAGHVWHVYDMKGTLLGGFESQESPIIAEITNEHAISLQPDESNNQLRPDKSPDGKWTFFIDNYNVCIISTDGKNIVQLSHDGSSANTYIIPQWAPDSKTLVAWRLDPEERKEVRLFESSPDGGVKVNLNSYPFPLPGDKLASFELNLFDVETRKQIKPDVDRININQPNLHWNSDGRCFAYEKTDRGHQRFRVIEVDSHTGQSRTIIDEKSKTFIWTIQQDLLNLRLVNWISGTNEIIYASERDGWKHLYLVNAETGKFTNQITRGEYVVRGIDKIDKEKRQIWFQASGMNADQDPYLVHYYRVNFDGTGLVALTEGNGSHSVQYSPDRNYIIDTYSRVDMAPVHELRRTSDGKKICMLEQADISELKENGWEAPEVFVAKGRDGKTDIWGIIYRPANFDPKKKYPIIEDIYAGPQGAPGVPKTFVSVRPYGPITDLGFIVVQMDGMGTAHRSKAFHDVCWKNLKDAGFPDRILWIKAAAGKYPYMDISRVGIYGVSAGGQNAAGAVLFHPEFYKVAVAACGCHDNRLDKAFWNEQWMGYPVGPQYAESSNIENAYRLQGHLLLIVGDKDDNVPPESTTLFADSLKKANKDFELLAVPGAGHGYGGVKGFRRMQDFFVQHLGKEKAPPPDNISYKKPGDNVPKSIQNLIGKWEGDWDGQFNSYVIVEEVTADSARVIFGWSALPAFGITKGGYSRDTARLTHIGNESGIDFEFAMIKGTLSADGKTIDAAYNGQSLIVMKKIEDPFNKNQTASSGTLNKDIILKAVPPLDVVYQKPANDVPPVIQGLLGQWEGKLDSDLNICINVEKVTSTKAHIVLGFNVPGSGYTRTIADLINTANELSLSISFSDGNPPTQAGLSADGKSITFQSGTMAITVYKTGEPVFSTEIKRYEEAVTGIVAFKDVNLITMRDNKIIPSQTVIVRDGRIVKIGSSSSITIPKEAKIVSGNGKKYLMPGLADMHVHLNDSSHLKLLVANGVTSVRNMWGRDLHLIIREDINSKQRVGPAIYSTGPLMDGNPPVHQGSTAVKTAEDAKKAVRKTKEDGFEFVKVYDRLGEEVYNTIMSTARELNIPVVGHIPAAVGFDKAVASGQYSFEHLYGATKQDRAWNTPRKDNDLAEYLKKTVASGVWNCPTLVVFKSSEMKRDELRKQPALKYVSRGIIESWGTRPAMNLSDEMRQNRLGMVTALHDAGAKLILGTDFPNPWVIPGFSLHEELSLMVKAGLSPYEAIKTGTVNAAEHMMKLNEFGTVEEGKRADLILIDQNPFVDVKNIANPLGVMTNGIWYPRSMLDQMLYEVEQEKK